MADLGETTIERLHISNPPASNDEAVRKQEFDEGLAGKSNTGHTHVNDHPAASAASGSKSLALTVSGSQAIGGEVKVASNGGLEIVDEGLKAKFGTSAGQIAEGNHQHANDHVPATAGEDTTTASVSVSNDQKVAANVKVAANGGIKVVVGENGGIAADIGTGANQVAAGNHPHPAVTNEAPGFMTPAMLSDLNAAAAIQPVTVTDTETIALTQAENGQISGDVVLGAGLKEDNGVAADFDVIAHRDHDHKVVTGIDEITPTAPGSDYTSPPAGTITGDGTGATVVTRLKAVSGLAIDAGSDYSPDDELTIVGGTATVPVKIRVLSVGVGGVIASTQLIQDGEYSAIPSNPASVTGGTGTGALFSLNWGLGKVIPTNRGIGYTAATVAFSGGAGTGAAASVTIWDEPGFVDPEHVEQIATHEDRLDDHDEDITEINAKLTGNLVPIGTVYSLGTYSLAVQAGRIYKWTPGENDISLDYSAGTLLAAGVFKAVNAMVTLYGTDEELVTAVVKDVTAEEQAKAALSEVIARAPLMNWSNSIGFAWGDLTTGGITIFSMVVAYPAKSLVFDPDAGKFYVSIRSVSGIATSNVAYWAELKGAYNADDWEEVDYVPGDQVRYTNGKDYQCHTATENAEAPTDPNFWGELVSFAPSAPFVRLNPNGGLEITETGLALKASEAGSDPDGDIVRSDEIPEPLDIGGPGAPGTSNEVARADHKHPLPLATEENHGALSKEDFKLLRSLGGGTGGALVGFDGQVWGLLIDGEHVYVCGNYLHHGSALRRYLAKLTLTGILVTEFENGISLQSPIHFIAKASDGDIIAGQANHGDVGKVDATTGNVNLGFNQITNIPDGAMKQLIATPGGKIAVLEPTSLKIYDVNGNLEATVPGTTDFSDILSVDGNQVLLSSRAFSATGVPQSYNGTTNPKGLKLVDLEADVECGCAAGHVVSAWSTGAGTGAEATCERIVKAPDGSYFIVGNSLAKSGADFSWNGGNTTSFRGLYKIMLDGTSDEANFECNLVLTGDAGTNAPIPFAIDSDGYIYIGGPIASIDDGTQQVAVTPWGLYRLKPSGLFDKEFTGFNSRVLCAAVKDNNLIIVGGEFTEYQGRGVGYIVFLDAIGKVVEPGTGSTPISEYGFVVPRTELPDVDEFPDFKKHLVRKYEVVDGKQKVLGFYTWDEHFGGWRSLCDYCGLGSYQPPPEEPTGEEVGEWLININFTTGQPIKKGSAAINSGASTASLDDVWNAITEATPNRAALKYAHDGSASEVNVTTYNFTLSGTLTNSDPMFKTYAGSLANQLQGQQQGLNLVAVFGNLPDGIYDVYVYAHGTRDEERGVIECKGLDFVQMKSTATSNWNDTIWAEDKQYVKFSSVRPALNKIEIRSLQQPPVSGRAYWLAVMNGIQLRKVNRLLPVSFEPATAEPPNEHKFSGTMLVRMSAHSGATIYYTTDGSEPDESSTPYTDVIELTETTVIKAKAFEGGVDPSDTATAHYTKV